MNQDIEGRLSKAASPYLRSAAHQPVDWFEWGPEAFARAKAEDKPILLDIGAVWCHWCHVIDRESYENPQIAALINQEVARSPLGRTIRIDRLGGEASRKVEPGSSAAGGYPAPFEQKFPFPR